MTDRQHATRLVTTTEAALALDVPAAAIANWKARRRITPVGMLRGPGRGGVQPLYRLAELQPLAEAYRRRVSARRVDDSATS